MSTAVSLLHPSILQHLIGVIDLRGGLAVHAVAGRRDRYQPVRMECLGNRCGRAGDVFRVARHYQDLGLSRLYIADLDAIIFGRRQFGAIDRLLAQCPAFDEVLVDCGLTGDEDEELPALDHSAAMIRWIVATESAVTTNAIARMCESFSPEHVILGLDYRRGRSTCRVADESRWIDCALRNQIHGFLPLDVDVVGTSVGTRTGPICHRLSKLTPRLHVYSGGGVRGASDAKRLLDSGCGSVLVATSLHNLHPND